MTIPKKGTRRAHLYDKAYRYVFKTYGGEDVRASVFIQEDCAEPGNVLEVSLNYVSIEDASIDINNPNVDIGRFGLGPGDIVELIKLAQIAGWDPSKKGPATRLEKDFIISRKPH